MGLEQIGKWDNLLATISFSTVVPALFETVELLRSANIFKDRKLRKKRRITKKFLHTIIFVGIVFLVAPVLLPTFTYPMIWISFFLILDPINYIRRQPSIISHLKDRKLVIPLTVLLAGIILGFLWEFWNYWATLKWVYSTPFVDSFKIFEMPALGYLFYFPFALEVYAMY